MALMFRPVHTRFDNGYYDYIKPYLERAAKYRLLTNQSEHIAIATFDCDGNNWDWCVDEQRTTTWGRFRDYYGTTVASKDRSVFWFREYVSSCQCFMPRTDDSFTES